MSVIFSRVSTWLGDCQTNNVKQFAPGEARTHGLQIMRLTRCLLRYGGTAFKVDKIFLVGNRKYLYPRGDSNPQSSV